MAKVYIDAYIPVNQELNLTFYQAIQNYCPVIDTVPASFARVITNDSHQIFGTDTLVCSYNPYTFRSVEAVDQYQRDVIDPYGVPTENSQYYIDLNQQGLSEAQQFLCSRLSDQCLYDFETCSPFSQTGEIGDYCRNLVNINRDASDAAKSSFCNVYETPDCGCLRASKDPNYTIFREELPADIADACFYIPCSNSSHPVLLSTTPLVDTCPVSTELCPPIEQIYLENRNTLTETVDETIFCLNTTVGGAIAFTNNTSFVVPSSGTGTVNQALTASYIGFIIVIIAVVIILLVYFYVIPLR